LRTSRTIFTRCDPVYHTPARPSSGHVLDSASRKSCRIVEI